MREVDAGSYRVIIGAGLCGHFAGIIHANAPASRYALIADENVARPYGDQVALSLAETGRVTMLRVPSGEAHKTRDTWARLTDSLLAAGCGRDTTIVALGGGVVGDLAGFVAATYMRGVPVVQCPTTLLAMIDASVGGKTGVDTPLGKNLVGAFHPPAIVLADVDTLTTLPMEHRRAGMAEAIKHGVIADADYFEYVQQSAAQVFAGNAGEAMNLVVRSVEIKTAVVRQDPRESGIRKTLNFGHTIGHAIEQASSYALLHGECVAIGMVYEARLAEQLGIARAGTAGAIQAALEGVGLPVHRPLDMAADAIVQLTHADKKARGGRVEYALPRRIGEMEDAGGRWSVPVDDEIVREILG